MATALIYPSYDNNIQVTGQSSWTAARTATSGNIGSSSSSTMSMRSEKISASDFRLSRIFLFFDTSELGVGATINSATLRVEVSNGVTGIDGALVEGTPASDSVVVGDDYDQVGTTEFATRQSFGSAGTKTFTLNANGLNNIDLTGTSIFAIRNERDIDNIEPTTNDVGYPIIYSVDDATEGNRPLLTINYEPAIVAPSFFFAM